MSRKKLTEDDGSPLRPWDEKEDFKEGLSLYGKPLGTMIAPRDMDDNEIDVSDVDQKPERPASIPNVTIKPHIAVLLASGYNVGAIALAKMERDLATQDFDNDMALRYHKVVDSVAKLAREERAQDATQEVHDMDDEELKAYLEEQIQKGVLTAGDE